MKLRLKHEVEWSNYFNSNSFQLTRVSRLIISAGWHSNGSGVGGIIAVNETIKID